MIRTLARKELRQLMPLVAALLVIELLGVAYLLLLRFPDELEWYELSTLLVPAQSEYVTAFFLIASVAAAGMLYAREYDQGTIGFLYSLPVRASTVFIVKVGSAVALMLTFVGVDALTSLLIAAANSSSITGRQLVLSTWILEWAMVSGVVLIGVGYGMLIAFFRRLGLMVAVMALLAVNALPALIPGVAYLSPLSLLRVEFRGSELIVDEAAWYLHGTLAVISIAISFLLWMRSAEDFTAFNARFTKHIATRVFTTVSIIAVAIGAAAAFYIREQRELDGEAIARAYGDIHTERYHFRYLLEDRDGVLALSAVADQDLAALVKLLHAAPVSTITADLSEISAEHLGIAGWKKIRIERGVLDNPTLRRHVLAHETTHVLAAAESQRRLAEYSDHAQFFSEGVAEWAAHRLVEAPRARAALIEHAAAAWQRFSLDFDHLMDSGPFVARYDDWLVYALGYAWVQALVNVCGERAPGDALRAMASAGAPLDLSGRRLWRDLLQSIRCDLTAVNGNFARSLSAHAVDSQRIPRLNGGVLSASGELLVFEVDVGDVDPSRNYSVTVRVRDNAQAGRAGTVQRRARASRGQPALLFVPASDLSGARFEYQFGVEFEPGESSFFEPWRGASRAR